MTFARPGQGADGTRQSAVFCRRDAAEYNGANVLSLCLLALLGCQPATTGTQPVVENTNSAAKSSSARDPQKVEALKPEVPAQAVSGSIKSAAPPSTDLIAGSAVVQIPQVHLSETHAKTLKVNVGDKFPSFSLPDGAGKPQTLDSLKGRLTLIVFWRANEPSAVEELRDLAAQYLPAYATAGLKVAAINSYDQPAATKAVLEQFQPGYPCLTDVGGKLLGQVGAGQLPRTFLLDAGGKVLWLDIEYSRTTRRQLLQALQAAFKEI